MARHVLTAVIGLLVGGVLVAGTPAPAPQTLNAILGIEVTGFTKNPSMERTIFSDHQPTASGSYGHGAGLCGVDAVCRPQ